MDKYKNKIFKLLPLFEGKVEGENLYLPKDIAFEQFQEYLGVLLIEFSGFEEEPFIEVFQYLKGLSGITENAKHSQVRNVILHCLSLLEG